MKLKKTLLLNCNNLIIFAPAKSTVIYFDGEIAQLVRAHDS
jgi:hypothetical protein